MTKKERSILFIIMLLLFLFLGPTLVLYSQGYRFDLESKRIVQSGALYFRASPRSVFVEVMTDDQSRVINRKTDFFFGTLFIENLLPKTHHIKIQKENYHPWQKSIQIGERLVSEFKNITLIPKEAKIEIAEKDIKELFYFPEKDKLIFLSNNNDLFFHENKQDSQLIFSYNEKEEIEVIDLLKDSEKVLVKADDNYFLINGEDQESTLISLPDNIQKISMTEEGVFFIKEGDLYLYKHEMKETSLFFEEVLDYRIDKKDIFYLSEDGFLMKNDNKINQDPVAFEESADIINLNPNIIKDEEAFYVFDRNDSKFKEIVQSDCNALISPDNKKMACYKDHEIRIIFLENIFDQPQREAGDVVFLTRVSDKIDYLNWYTSHYLIFTTTNQIKTIEIDNRDHINVNQIAEIDFRDIFFRFSDKRLYLLSDQNLIVSEKLVP